MIVIGGSLSQAGDSLLAGIREAIYARSLPLATTELQVVPSQTGQQAAIQGAAAMVLQHTLGLSSLPAFRRQGEDTAEEIAARLGSQPRNAAVAPTKRPGSSIQG